MPSTGEIREQVAIETRRRQKLAVPAFGGGFLYLLSAIIITETLNAAPTVGLVQGLTPALSGVANPAVSPRTAEVKFVSHHAFTLIAGGTLAAIAFVMLTLILLLLLDATRFRRPEMWRYARPLVLGGGIAVAIVSIGRQVASALEAHSFAVGHDFSIHAAERALSTGTANVLADYLGLIATLALTVGMIATMLAALRVGLIVRWMSIVGMFAAVLILIPDRRQRARGRAGVLDGDDGHPVHRQMAERRAARVGCRRGQALALAGGALQGTGERGELDAERRRGGRRPRARAAGRGRLFAQAPAQARGARLMTLEGELASLLEVESFEPPVAFREHALLSDPAIYEQAAADPQAWWAAQAERLDWFQKWTRVLDDDDPPFYKWFTGGTLNVSYNCLDRHVIAGRGERVAFHWRGEEGQERDITYAALLAEVERFASALKDLGVEPGDVVGIYLPMIPEVVVAMLACARIGAPHNVVFGGFAAEAVRERMEFSQAKVLITVDGAARKGRTAPVKDRVDEVMGDLESLEKIVVVQSKGTPCQMQEGRDVFYEEIVAAADPVCPAEPLDAEHPLYILYTSGSTAKPKGILHTTGGYLTGVSATHRYVFDLKPEILTCTGARRTSAGSRATPTSSTARCATAPRR